MRNISLQAPVYEAADRLLDALLEARNSSARMLMRRSAREAALVRAPLSPMRSPLC